MQIVPLASNINWRARKSVNNCRWPSNLTNQRNQPSQCGMWRQYPSGPQW